MKSDEEIEFNEEIEGESDDRPLDLSDGNPEHPWGVDDFDEE